MKEYPLIKLEVRLSIEDKEFALANVIPKEHPLFTQTVKGWVEHNFGVIKDLILSNPEVGKLLDEANSK